MNALVNHQLTLVGFFYILVICTQTFCGKTFLIILFTYLFLAVLGLCCVGFSPVVMYRLFAVTSLTVEPRLSGMWALGVVARGLSSGSSQALEQGSTAVAHGLSFSVACGILPDQGLNPCLLH